MGGLNVAIPLHILASGGSVIDVGFAAAASNLAMVPGSLFWGYVVDIYDKRKPILVLPYLASTLLIVGLFYATQIPLIILLNALIAFFFIASYPVTSLLLMENTNKTQWTTLFARMRTLTQLGVVFGVAPGVIWTTFFNLKDYFLFLSALAAASVAMAQIMVKEPPISLERRVFTHEPARLFHKLFNIPLFFLKLPHPSDFKVIWKSVQSSLTHQLPLLYTSGFLYFLGGNIFGTSFIPFMKSSKISDQNVFAVNLAAMIVAIISFPLAGRYTIKKGEAKTTEWALIGRALAMALGALIALVSVAVLETSFVVLILMTFTFAFYQTASSNLLFNSLHEGRKGELLGVYSAITGSGLLIGSLGSGYFSFSLGFAATFAIGAVMMIVALRVFRSFRNALQ